MAMNGNSGEAFGTSIHFTLDENDNSSSAGVGGSLNDYTFSSHHRLREKTKSNAL